MNEKIEDTKYPIVFACKLKDDVARVKSTSGGAFSALANAIRKRNGYVCGAVFDQNFCVKHQLFSAEENYDSCKGSKYVQSQNLAVCYRDIKKILGQGNTVMFTGMPCQVNGLRNYIGNTSNLICVDLMCMGIGSPGLWDKFLKEEFKNEKIEQIHFKKKIPSWHRWHTVIKTDQREVATRGGQGQYMRAYLEGHNARPSCYQCKIKEANRRKADITISDFWGVEKFYPEFDDDRGTSCVFIYSEVGEALFLEAQSDLEWFPITFLQATQYNPYYLKAEELPKTRKLFWYMAKKLPLARVNRIIVLLRKMRSLI